MPVFTAPDGVRLHYEIEGHGPPLLLHLGAGCDASLWLAAGYLDALSRTYSCILFDHRGHGLSDHPTGAAANHIDRYADDVVALVGHLGYQRVSFFGWSNAVVVGLKAAQQRPGLFGAMVLFGPIARRATREQLAAGIRERLTELRSRRWRYLLDDMTAAEKVPVPQWMLDRITATDIEPYIAWTEARPSWNWSPWDALPLIDSPTLMIVGELEDPEDVMGEAASLMPDASRNRIPDRDHINAFLASEIVLPHVTEFLSRHAAR
jgi:pimeloyl-ACP methyl ester carboxylesterase